MTPAKPTSPVAQRIVSQVPPSRPAKPCRAKPHAAAIEKTSVNKTPNMCQALASGSPL